jgi:hypothetical protein
MYICTKCNIETDQTKCPNGHVTIRTGLWWLSGILGLLFSGFWLFLGGALAQMSTTATSSPGPGETVLYAVIGLLPGLALSVVGFWKAFSLSQRGGPVSKLAPGGVVLGIGAVLPVAIGFLARMGR